MRRLLLLLPFALLLVSCVVAPTPAPVWIPPPPGPLPPADVFVPPVDAFAPPAEYLVDPPLVYPQMPGVVFYPLFIDVPGSCHCVMPMRFVGGAWVGVDGHVVHRGHFPWRRPEAVHLDAWRAHGGVVHGMRPLPGPPPQSGPRILPHASPAVTPPGPAAAVPRGPAPPSGESPGLPSGRSATPRTQSTPSSGPVAPAAPAAPASSRPPACAPKEHADRKC